MAGRPAAFHRYVSSDPTVHVAGTALPEASTQPVALPRLASAVASVFRTTEDALFTRSPARMALVRAAAWYEINPSEVRRFTGLSYPAWHRLTASAPTRGGYVRDPVLVACLSAAADPRFTALSTTDRRSERAWARYALRR